MWTDTPLTRLLGIRLPIVQGPFGGGLSSERLAAEVSEAGGLGSYGLQGMAPAKIAEVAASIRALTSRPFALNLWVSVEDQGARDPSAAAVEDALRPLAPFFAELGLAPPRPPLRPWPSFEEQAKAVLEARPAVFSFVFGVPPPDLLEACRARGIATAAAATTVEEAVALDRAGVDAIVATGFEAGGHRPSFLRRAEESLHGTLALVPLVARAVRAPVVAAGGIADGRGVAAALALGAAGAQLGTSFLACDESNAPPLHRDALHAATPGATTLTRAFSGRLGRGIRNALVDAVEGAGAYLAYPAQGQLVGALREEALRRARTDLVCLWAGQGAPLVKHRRARELVAALEQEAGLILATYRQ